MVKSTHQIEKNVSASFGYVKKDMLMLNDAFSDLHDKVQHLSLNHATLLDEMRKLRADITSASKAKSSVSKAKVSKPKKKASKKSKKKAAKPVKKVVTETTTYQ